MRDNRDRRRFVQIMSRTEESRDIMELGQNRGRNWNGKGYLRYEKLQRIWGLYV